MSSVRIICPFLVLVWIGGAVTGRTPAATLSWTSNAGIETVSPASHILIEDAPARSLVDQVYPGPAHMHPRIHYTPACLNSRPPSSHDVAAALSVAGTHHVWQLCAGGWHHGVSVDLVHWSTRGIGPDDWPSGFATVDPQTDRVCVGLKSPLHVPGGQPWDAPLALRCATDANATQFGPYEPFIDVYYYRSLPYDPFRPFQDLDGQWYAGIAADGCNETTRKMPCAAGGQVDLWTSPELRGEGASWRQLPPMFTTNRTIWAGDEREAHELVTIDYIGGLAGDPSGARRVLLNNAYFARGSTEYFVGRQANVSLLHVDFDVAGSHWMLDWGEFTLNASAAGGGRGPAGVEALSKTPNNPSGGRLGMVRTLGSDSGNQVSRPGRRVAVGWISAMNGSDINAPGATSMSLPRDLSLQVARGAGGLGGRGEEATGGERAVRLLQAFAPELQSLRGQSTRFSSGSSSISGQQVEILAQFSTAGETRQRPFGVKVLSGDVGGSREGTTIAVHPSQGLVCVNGTLQGNPQLRCGPLVAIDGVSSTVMHVIVDHSIIEVIVNNITAITASVAPSTPAANGVALFGVGDDNADDESLSAVVDVWELRSANNPTPSDDSSTTPYERNVHRQQPEHVAHA